MQDWNNEDIINQIITKNYAEYEASLVGGKIKAVFRTLQTGDQLEVEEQMSEIKEKSQLYILHQYSLLLLSKSLIKYNDQKFDPTKSKITYDFLSALPSSLIDVLSKQREDFQKAVLQLLVPGELEKYFFPQSSSDAESSSS